MQKSDWTFFLRAFLLAVLIVVVLPFLYGKVYNAYLIYGIPVDIPSSDRVDGRTLTYDSTERKIKLEKVTASDLTISGATIGDVLYYDGTNWNRLARGLDGQILIPRNGTISYQSLAGDVSGSVTNTQVTDLTIPSEASGDVLVFNGTSWTRHAIGTTQQTLVVNSDASGAEWASIGGDVTGPVTSTTVTDLTISGQSAGDLLYYDGTNWKRQAIGTAQQVAVVNSDASGIEYGTIGGDVTGPVTSTTVTDLTISGQTAGDVLYFNGTNWVRLAKGTAGQVLEMNAGATAPEWGTDDVGAGVTVDGKGQVQGHDGSTAANIAAGTDGQVLIADSADTEGAQFSSLAGDVTGSVTATAVSDLTISGQTAGDLLYFDGTNWKRQAIGTAQQVAVVNSDASGIEYGTIGGDVTGSVTATTVTDFTISGQAAGDVLFFDGTNWVRLPKGTAGQLLEMNSGATAPIWDSTDVTTTRIAADSISITNTSPGYEGLFVFQNTEDTVGVSARYITLRDSDFDLTGIGDCIVVQNVSRTCDITASVGAGGPDVAGLDTTGHRYIWVIYNPTTGDVNTLITEPSRIPVLPSGYTFYRLVGSVYNNSSNDFHWFQQVNNSVSINNDNVVSKVLDAGSSTSWATVDCSVPAPPIARELMLTGQLKDDGTASAPEYRARIASFAQEDIWSITVGHYASAAYATFIHYMTGVVPCDASQQIRYQVTSSTYDLSIQVIGYTLQL